MEVGKKQVISTADRIIRPFPPEIAKIVKEIVAKLYKAGHFLVLPDETSFGRSHKLWASIMRKRTLELTRRSFHGIPLINDRIFFETVSFGEENALGVDLSSLKSPNLLERIRFSNLESAITPYLHGSSSPSSFGPRGIASRNGHPSRDGIDPYIHRPDFYKDMVFHPIGSIDKAPEEIQAKIKALLNGTLSLKQILEEFEAVA